MSCMRYDAVRLDRPPDPREQCEWTRLVVDGVERGDEVGCLGLGVRFERAQVPRFEATFSRPRSAACPVANAIASVERS